MHYFSLNKSQITQNNLDSIIHNLSNFEAKEIIENGVEEEIKSLPDQLETRKIYIKKKESKQNESSNEIITTINLSLNMFYDYHIYNRPK